MKGYIAKDFDGTIWLYRHKPTKNLRQWVPDVFDGYKLKSSDLPNNISPKWRDAEPIEVEVSFKPIKNKE